MQDGAIEIDFALFNAKKERVVHNTILSQDLYIFCKCALELLPIDRFEPSELNIIASLFDEVDILQRC